MILIYIAIAIVTFILYVKWRQTYWQRKGVPVVKPEFFFGNGRKFMMKQISAGDMILNWYREAKKLGSSKHGGMYQLWQPCYVPMEPALIRQILQKDFNHFMDHGVYHHPKDVLTMHLFNLEGEKWKKLRAKLTPTFTSSKMKMMFETILEKTEGLEKVVGNYADKHEPFVSKEVMGRFTTDVIGSCGFGIECNSMEDPDNAFRTHGKMLLKPRILGLWLTSFVPWGILGHLGFKNYSLKVTKFFINTVKETIRIRETNEIYRKDFMHLLLQLKNQGVTSDSTKIISERNTKTEHLLTENEIIAQCFVFFSAGFQTSSTTMTFTLLELAQNLNIQDKLRQEISTVLAKHSGNITYDAVMEMTYLEKVINETLRRFPPAVALPRVCRSTYTVPDTDVVIEKGTRVLIPVWGIQMDPQYYPNPEMFDPERFSEENKASRPESTFIPFGEGPRMCIGSRFGMLQSKLGLVSLLRKFKFTLNKKTPLPIEIEEGSRMLTVKGNVWLDATRI